MNKHDYRALCAELVAAVDEASDAVDRTSDCVNAGNHPELWAQCVDLIRRQDDLLSRARAALAQPEPVAPTDEELDEFAVFWWGSDTDERTVTDVIECCSMTAYAHAVLARWVTPAIEPVPVSERLPEPEDCDAEGGCWWWHPDHKEDDFDDGWILLNPKWADGRRDSDDSLIYTHWLPANALPTPEPTNV
jgi:hypothetical protein